MTGVVIHGRFAAPVPAVGLGENIIFYDSEPFWEWGDAIAAAITPLVGDAEAAENAASALAAVVQLYQLPTAEMSYLLGLPDTRGYADARVGAITYKVPGGWRIRVSALGFAVFVDDALNPASITAEAIPAGGDPTPYTPSGVSVYVPPFWTDFVKSAEDYSGWSGEAGSWGGDWVPEEPEVYGPYGPYEVVMVAGTQGDQTGFGSGFGSLEPATISTPVGDFPLREISTSTMGYLCLYAGRSYLIEKVLVAGPPGGAVEVAPWDEVPVSAPFVDGTTYNLQLTFYVNQGAWPPEDKTGTYLLNFVAQTQSWEPTAHVTVDGATFSLYWSASENLLYLGATYGEDDLPLEFNSIVMTGDLGPVTFVPNDPGELNYAWEELPGGQQLVDGVEYSITLVVS